MRDYFSTIAFIGELMRSKRKFQSDGIQAIIGTKLFSSRVSSFFYSFSVPQTLSIALLQGETRLYGIPVLLSTQLLLWSGEPPFLTIRPNISFPKCPFHLPSLSSTNFHHRHFSTILKIFTLLSFSITELCSLKTRNIFYSSVITKTSR